MTGSPTDEPPERGLRFGEPVPDLFVPFEGKDEGAAVTGAITLTFGSTDSYVSSSGLCA